jgi:hypothetical protein
MANCSPIPSNSINFSLNLIENEDASFASVDQSSSSEDMEQDINSSVDREPIVTAKW